MKTLLKISIALFIIISFFRFMDKIGGDPREDDMKWSIYSKVEPLIKSKLNYPSTYRNGFVSLTSLEMIDSPSFVAEFGEGYHNFSVNYYASNAFGVESSFTFKARVDYDLNTMKYTIIKIY